MNTPHNLTSAWLPAAATGVRVTVGTPKGGTTLVVRQHEAQLAQQSMYSASVSHILRDKHFDPRGYDQCNLVICLTTVLAYIYSRSAYLVLAGFVVWFLFESIVFFSLPLFSRAIKQHVQAVESRDYEPVFDWLLFLAALVTAYYALECTLLTFAVPSTFPEGAGEWLTFIVVTLVSLLAVFPDIFFLSGGILLTTIWIAYALTASSLHLSIAVRATLATVYFYVWFRKPIAFSFLFNGFMSLLAASFTLSLLTGVVIPP